MRKFVCFFIVMIGYVLVFKTAGIAQQTDMVLDFDGKNAQTGATVQLKSVSIKNLTKDCDTTLYGATPYLYLTWPSSIHEMMGGKKSRFSISPNYPNPFTSSTSFELTVLERSSITIKLLDLYGALHATFQQELDWGLHTFEVFTAKHSIYFINVNNGITNHTIKLVSIGSADNQNQTIRYRGIENLKAGSNINAFAFSPGDQLMMKATALGYYDKTLFHNPTENTSYIFQLEPVPPIEITAIEISADNATVKVTFNQALYRNSDKTGDLDATSFAITFSSTNLVLATFLVDHNAGIDFVTFNVNYETRLQGIEVLNVKALTNMIYGTEGNQLIEDLETSVDVNDLGIIGNWSAYDISDILIGLGFDDSLYANFNADQSYLIRAFASGYPIVLEGTYMMNKTLYEDRWEISLDQTAQNGQPTYKISQGIFAVFYEGNTASMFYEVAQVDPAIAGITPPTAQQGFGSTSGGAFGQANVQKYNWIGQ